MVILLQGCHDPKELVSNGDPKGILKLTAMFVDDASSENLFDSEIDYDNHTIKVRFPMYYPKASFDELKPEDIQNVRITASLANNTTVEPALTTLDLTKNNIITVKNPQGVKTQYNVTGEIVKLWECDMLEIELADGTPGIIDEKNHIITLVATTELEPQTAILKYSPHATVSPDIENEPFDFNTENATITVTAHNGVDKKEYTIVKGEPKRLPFGYRDGSESLRWVKRWDEVGLVKTIVKPDRTVEIPQTGIGVTEKYIVLNQLGTMQGVVLKASDGSDTGKRLDMSIIPNGKNNNMTSDHAGNIIVNSKYTNDDPSFKLWVFKGIDDKGTLLINQSVWGAGERVSVYGDITKDAVIVTTLSGTNLQACRWFVKDGVLGKSEVFTLGGIASTPYGNADIAPTSATDPTANMYAVVYATVSNKRGPALFDGTTFAPITVGKPNTKKRNEADGGLADAGNWVMNACDYREFNNGKYFLHNSVNTFSWGDNDRIYLLDVASGDLNKELIKTSETDGAIKFLVDPKASVTGLYGAMSAGNLGIGANGNDARLWVSSTGFYMYAYFFFTNGYIGCVRVDCIQY